MAVSRKISILVVEDNKETCAVLSRLIGLSFPDLPILTAENGRAGLELFTRHAPKIVITDIYMPEMDGLEMGMIIRSIDPEVKIIAVTAFRDQLLLDDIEKAGFDEYLFKPLNMGKLNSAIKKCLAVNSDSSMT